MDVEYTEDMLTEKQDSDMLFGFKWAIENVICRKEELEDADEYDYEYPTLARLNNEIKLKIYDEIIENLKYDCHEFLVSLIELEEKELVDMINDIEIFIKKQNECLTKE